MLLPPPLEGADEGADLAGAEGADMRGLGEDMRGLGADIDGELPLPGLIVGDEGLAGLRGSDGADHEGAEGCEYLYLGVTP